MFQHNPWPTSDHHAIILLCEAPASSEEVVEEDNLLDSAREAVQQENLCKLCANYVQTVMNPASLGYQCFNNAINMLL